MAHPKTNGNFNYPKAHGLLTIFLYYIIGSKNN